MQASESPLTFDSADVLDRIDQMDDASLDRLAFGVIAFDSETRVLRYNAREARFSGLRAHQLLGQAMFTELAQCMNNYLVAQRFEDARAAGDPLDATVDYVLTWRMKPSKVQLRLLYAPDSALSYVLLRHD